MSTDTALLEKREELKRRLEAGEYKTLVDIFLEWFDRMIRKITRRSAALPIWSIVVILCLAYYLITFIVSYIVQDGLTLAIMRSQGAAAGFGPRFVLYSSPALFIISIFVMNQYIHRIINLWRDDLLDATETVTSLEEFENWLKKACNWQVHLLVTLSGALLGGFYIAASTSKLNGVFMGYGFVFGAIFLLVYLYAFVYLVLIAVLLSARIRRYELKLFAADPGTSEPIARLSGELGFFVSFVAVFAAILTLLNASMGILQETVIAVLFLWTPIILMFVLNQTSLASMIRRAKWKTLNGIQARIEKLQAAENLEAKDTMDAINRLLDYHERVNKTRNSALDFRTYLSFINSLLLPLLAFVLGNLDLVLKLFVRTP